MSQSVTTQTEQGLYVHPEALTAHLPALDYRGGALHMEQVSIDELVKNYKIWYHLVSYEITKNV